MKKTRPKKRRHPESILCQNLWKWFFYEWREYRPFYLRIENSRGKSVIQQSILKSEGAKAGTPDLFLAVPVAGFHGLWLEVKTAKTEISKKGVVSEHQLILLTDLQDRGYACAIGFGIDECRKIINNYLNGEPLKGVAR